VDVPHYESWKRKKVRCLCVGTEPNSNLTVDKAKGIAENSNEYAQIFSFFFFVFACILISYLQLWNVNEEVGVKKQKKRAL